MQSPPPEVRDLLALTLVPGLGPRLTSALLERFGSPSGVRRARADELLSIPHIGAKLAQQFTRALEEADVDSELALIARHGVRLIPRTEAEYPTALAEIPDAPHLLYTRGEFSSVDARAVAIVGSRQFSTYGRKVTEQIAAGLARAGFTVVSGLARGIDGIAHRAALDAGGRSIAVLAGGLSSIYPPEHTDLAQAITNVGAVISETPMRMSPQKGMFHARNRLISGLARAVVIVEAGDQSGALITARHAVEQGRDVFAVPADVDSGFSKGSLRLLRQGARLIRGVDDLLEDLRATPSNWVPSESPPHSRTPEPETLSPIIPPGLDDIQRQIWEFLSERRHADEITRALSIPVGQLSAILMNLEIKRIVRRLAGNCYERCA